MLVLNIHAPTVPPMIDTISPPISTVSGRSVSLYCHTTGEEPPRITWRYTNGTVISDNDRGSSSLTLDNVHAEGADKIDIECVASNSIGSVSRTTSITTVGKGSPVQKCMILSKYVLYCMSYTVE